VLGWFARNGWSGVDVFFVLSGFLITTLLRREVVKTGSVHLGWFWGRRIVRLWPSSFLALGLTVLLTWRLSEKNPAIWTQVREHVLDYVLFYANYSRIWYGDMGPVSGHFWSLAVEEHFYVAWPLVAWALASRPRALGVVAFVGALVPAVLRPLEATPGVDPWHNAAATMATHCRFDSILWGCVLALVFPRLPDLGRRGQVVALVVATVLFSAGVVLRRQVGVVAYAGCYPLVAFASAIYVWVALKGPTGGLRALLASRPMVLGGRASYGIYLVHLIALTLVFGAEATLRRRGIVVPYVAVMVGAVVASLAAGGLFYLLIDRPLEPLRRRMRPAVTPSSSER
jgi:peptidoglycan/LPS O-acetylase OafA/YrhL